MAMAGRFVIITVGQRWLSRRSVDARQPQRRCLPLPRGDVGAKRRVRACGLSRVTSLTRLAGANRPRPDGERWAEIPPASETESMPAVAARCSHWWAWPATWRPRALRLAWHLAWRFDGLQIRGQRPRRLGIAGIVLLQEQIEREGEAVLGKPARAAVAGRAALGKQLWRRLAGVEIFLCRRRARGEHRKGGERKQAAPVADWRHQDGPAREADEARAATCRAPMAKKRLPVSFGAIRSGAIKSVLARA